MVALLLSACRLEQEIRFNADGSGTASITVGIDTGCRPLGTLDCDERAQRLLRGEGPVAQAEADAESLPFDVRVEPFEDGPPESPTEIGYTLSFDFASLEDLEQKLAPGGRSQTSALEFSGMTLEANGDGGFTFTAETEGSVLGGVPFAIVLPGAEGKHNADVAEGAEGGTRFQWHIGGYVAGESTKQLQASTCSRGACPGSSTPVLVVVAVAVMAAVVVAFVLMRRERDKRSRRADMSRVNSRRSAVPPKGE